jgi:predicted DsbA family dithiol-disulfide isomerase
MGISQLQQGVDAYNAENPAAPVKLHHRLHPYQLRSDMSYEPVARNADMDARYGSGGRGPGIRANLAQQFADAGLKYAPDSQLANTHRAHRLEMLARSKGDEESWNVGMELMRAYQEGGEAPSDPKVLARVGVKHGLFASEAEGEKWVLSDALDKETKAAYAEGRGKGINGVPNFIFQDKYQTSGAIGKDAFKSVIAQIVAKDV